MRASLGHPEPYRLQFVEIGNEDNLSNGCATYPQRFLQFFNAIRAAYPQITVITSTADPACLPNPIPAGVWLDFHDYNVPENYVREYTFFDTWDRAHPVMIGEYARWGVKWSDMQGACSEAVYMMGWERNSDLVQMAAFAPTLQNYDPINGQWTVSGPSQHLLCLDSNGVVTIAEPYPFSEQAQRNRKVHFIPCVEDVLHNYRRRCATSHG